MHQERGRLGDADGDGGGRHGRVEAGCGQPEDVGRALHVGHQELRLLEHGARVLQALAEAEAREPRLDDGRRDGLEDGGQRGVHVRVEQAPPTALAQGAREPLHVRRCRGAASARAAAWVVPRWTMTEATQ